MLSYSCDIFSCGFLPITIAFLDKVSGIFGFSVILAMALVITVNQISKRVSENSLW